MTIKLKNTTYTLILICTLIFTSHNAQCKKRTTEKKEQTNITLDCKLGSGKCDLESGHCTTNDGQEGICYTDSSSSKKKSCNCYAVCDRNADVSCYKKCITHGYGQGRCKNTANCPDSTSEQSGPDEYKFNCCCSVLQ